MRQADGADLIDVGGESTRPGASPTSEADEIARVVPIVEALARDGALVSVDTMTFARTDGGTEVTYTAEFTFKGLSRLLAPLLRPAFTRLGNDAEVGLRSALVRLSAESSP